MRKGFAVATIGIALCGLTAAVWLLVPTAASLLLERWLHNAGFEEATIRVELPGWGLISLSNIRLKHLLQDEALIIESRETVIRYSLAGLLAGRFDEVALPDVRMGLTAVPPPIPQESEGDERHAQEQFFSLFNMVTVSDLVRGIPLLPWDDLQLGRLEITRERATGPFRQLKVGGSVRQRGEGLLATITVQGSDTQAYELRVSDLATGIMSLQLAANDSSSVPILSWRSEAIVGEAHAQLRGMIDVNVQALAPFLALVLPAGSEWRETTGRIQANWVGTASTAAALASVWHDPDTQVQGTMQLAVKLPALAGLGRKLTAAMIGTFSGSPGQLRWTIEPGTIATADIELKNMAGLAPYRKLLPPDTQTFRIESGRGVSGELRAADSPPSIRVQGPLMLSMNSTQDAAHAEMSLALVTLRGSRLESAEGTFDLVGDLPKPLSESLSIQRVMGKVEGRFSMRDAEIQGSLLPSSSITAVKFRQGAVRVDRGSIVLANTPMFRFVPGTGEWTVTLAAFALRVPVLRWADEEVMVQDALLKMEEAGGAYLTRWRGRGTAVVQGISVGRQAGRSIPADLTVRLAADEVAVKADVRVDTPDHVVTLDAEAEHILATHRGWARGTIGPIRFDHDKVRLRRLWNSWPYPLDIEGGRAQASGELTWDAGLSDAVAVKSGTAVITLENLRGYYREFAFVGLHTTLDLAATSPEKGVTLRPTKVEIASFRRGIEATHISFTVQSESDSQGGPLILEIRDVRWEVLGGTMTSQGVRADLSHPPYAFTVLARAVDLGKVLNLEQQKGLEGTGLLDGTIPVSVTSGGISIKDGAFESRPPGGVIRYSASSETSKALTDANASMELVLKALNNFHYNVLQVESQYEEDGQLHLKARLEGRNPDLKQSPPIHLNLTVQESVPALLKSLRLVQDIETSVENRFVLP
ncbi:MAG: YdbH domain-containing protein [Nitrospira sp.]|nr:YdbH domain-containing protein [Nitrospira sp.]